VLHIQIIVNDSQFLDRIKHRVIELAALLL